MFIFSLYPLWYLLARTALGERAAQLMEAARLLGALLPRRIRAVAFAPGPPGRGCRRGVGADGDLADFGVASYFGIQTFTTGIYKAWLSMDNRLAAAQLATMLLVVVLALLHSGAPRPKSACAFAAGGAGACGSSEAQPLVLRGGPRGGMAGVRPAGADGFVAPIAFMLRPLAADWSVLPWGRFVEWALAQCAAGRHHFCPGRGCGADAGLLPCAGRPDGVTRGVVQLASLGYRCRAR